MASTCDIFLKYQIGTVGKRLREAKPIVFDPGKLADPAHRIGLANAGPAPRAEQSHAGFHFHCRSTQRGRNDRQPVDVGE